MRVESEKETGTRKKKKHRETDGERESSREIEQDTNSHDQDKKLTENQGAQTVEHLTDNQVPFRTTEFVVGSQLIGPILDLKRAVLNVERRVCMIVLIQSK